MVHYAHRVTTIPELSDHLRRYYTAYYRDTLGILDWTTLVGLRDREEREEQRHLARLRALTGAWYRLSGVAPFIEVVARKP
jgi:hypothetical protein